MNSSGSRADERRWYEKALTQLKVFSLGHDLTVQPFMLEAPIEAEVTPGLILRGRVNRVDREFDGSLHIIDYKTGNVPEQTDWTQLHLHALILRRQVPDPVDRISFYYLSFGVVKTALLQADDLERVAWDLLATARGIEKEKRYTPTRGPHCRYCDFLPICPAKGKAQREDIEGDFELWRDSVAGSTVSSLVS